MRIAEGIIANADDFGMKQSVNSAIVRCFEMGYINSTSLMTNTGSFNEAVDLIHSHKAINNVGVHVNLLEGKPLSNFTAKQYLDENGNWDKIKINNKFLVLQKPEKMAFVNEIKTQVDKALDANVRVSHLDSHYHLHTLPAFFELFLSVAKLFKLKIRIAQTYSEGNIVNYFYRLYINRLYRQSNLNYSEQFVTVEKLMDDKKIILRGGLIEVMLHPDLDSSGELFDHVDRFTLFKWMQFVDNKL